MIGMDFTFNQGSWDIQLDMNGWLPNVKWDWHLHNIKNDDKPILKDNYM
jgi:hypothetical protein